MRQQSRLSRRGFLGLSRGSETFDHLLFSPFADTDGITPEGNLFCQHMSGIPVVDTQQWSLYVDGFVSSPRLWTLDDLIRLDWDDRICTIACAGLSSRNTLVGTARWGGVWLSSLLDRMELGPRADYLQFTCADGYRTSLPVRLADRALLAFEMNGKPLPAEHGYPLRLIAAGLFGYKMPKWIQQITLTSAPLSGYWESRGLPEDGQMPLMSVFFRPSHEAVVTGSVLLSGAAFAGTQSTARVEVSADDGPWMPAQFSRASIGQWTLWHQIWQPPGAGIYVLRVRVTDDQGIVQSDAIHKRVVHVVDELR